MLRWETQAPLKRTPQVRPSRLTWEGSPPDAGRRHSPPSNGAALEPNIYSRSLFLSLSLSLSLFLADCRSPQLSGIESCRGSRTDGPPALAPINLSVSPRTYGTLGFQAEPPVARAGAVHKELQTCWGMKLQMAALSTSAGSTTHRALLSSRSSK